MVKYRVEWLVLKEEKVNGHEWWDHFSLDMPPQDALHFARQAKELGYKPRLHDLMIGMDVSFLIER